MLTIIILIILSLMRKNLTEEKIVNEAEIAYSIQISTKLNGRDPCILKEAQDSPD
jgi:hypothetical protein